MSAAEATILTLHDDTGLRLTLIDWGATWWSLQLPVAGQPRELLLGGATVAAQRANSAYFGAIVGRYANRIAGARIEREGRSWKLAPHPAGSPHQLHGGPDGFDKRRWRVLEQRPDRARFALRSPDGDQGFPGAVDAEVDVRLPGGGVVELRMHATATAPTPLCLTNHAYFNLDGATTDVRAHRLRLEASRYAPVDAELIPLGALEEVAGTGFDFRALRPLRRAPRAGSGGADEGIIDHAYLLDARCADPATPAAVVESADRRVRMSISTSLPALQLYTGEYLARETGRDGRPLPAHAGLALEPGYLPDSPHHPEWPQPDCWLMPGQPWTATIRYAFSVD